MSYGVEDRFIGSGGFDCSDPSGSLGRTLLIIPEYNDSHRLEPFMKCLCSKLTPDFDVLVVSDGSSPYHVESITKLVALLRSLDVSPGILDPISYKDNRGKGKAIRVGFSARTKEHSFVGFVDADGAVSPEEVIRLNSILLTSSSVGAVVGVRLSDGAMRVRRAWHRRVLSDLFSFAVGAIVGLGIPDTQCGLKILRVFDYEKVEPLLSVDRYAFDIELCAFLRRRGVQLLGVPINWEEVGGSKVRPLKDGLSLLLETFKIRRRVSQL